MKTPKKITLGQLVRMLEDPGVSMEEVKPYLTTDRTRRIGMAPVLLPNLDYIDDSRHERMYRHTRADIGMGLLNRIAQCRRRRKVQKRIEKGDKRPILVAEGDSWFQYPVWVEDTVDWLLRRYNVVCLSAAGDDLSEMIKECDYWELLKTLDAQGHHVRALLLSGGGNDVTGDSLECLLNQWHGQSEADELVNHHEVNRVFGSMVNDYRSIFERVRSGYPSLPILVHGYDYAIPLPDQGFHIPPRDGWLGDPMRAKGIGDSSMQKEIMELLINQFNSRLQALDEGVGGVSGVHYVDNRGSVGDDGWRDEMHAKNEGFCRIAGNFQDKLTQIDIEGMPLDCPDED